jgi:hypothetical protein
MEIKMSLTITPGEGKRVPSKLLCPFLMSPSFNGIDNNMGKLNFLLIIIVTAERVRGCRPVVPATREAEVGGSLEPGVQEQPEQQARPCLKTNKQSKTKNNPSFIVLVLLKP